MTAIRLGTRGSALAIAQSGQVAESLRRRGHAVELVQLRTPGDGSTDPLAGRSQTGIFTSSLQEALVAREIDLAVHSLKDLPTRSVGSTKIVAVPRRVDPRDAIVSTRPSIDLLRGDSVVGTCSHRRAAWVLRHRPDVQVQAIRGNVDDRIAQLRAGRFDAIILAVAGLHRLGRRADIAAIIPASDLVPAPAQGALGLEIRTGDRQIADAVAPLDDPRSRLAVDVERGILDVVDPDDALALGVLATFRDGVLHVLADRSEPDGSWRRVVRRSARVSGRGDAQRVIDVVSEALAAQCARVSRVMA